MELDICTYSTLAYLRVSIRRKPTNKEKREEIVNIVSNLC